MSEEPGSRDQTARRAEIETIRATFRADQAKNIEEWQKSIHSQVPSILYHYTTAGGLIGILDSHSLWVSDVRFMNDASELTYAVDLIANTVKDVLGAVTDERLKSSLSGIEREITIFDYGPRPFCACFCEQGDLLSQWRGYAPGQLGYSLGLDLRNVGLTVDLPRNTVLRKVIYDEQEQHAWVRRITETWLQSVHAALDSRPGMEVSSILPYPAIWALQEALIELHLCFKNPAFSEEREWRLVKLTAVRDELSATSERRMRERFAQFGVKIPPPPVRPLSNSEGIEIKFRPSSFGFIPYVLIGLKPRAGVFMGRLPLKKVIQGPTAAPSLSLSSLVMYLEAQGYGFPHTEISQSEIPLRS